MKMTIQRDNDITHVVLNGRLDTPGVEEIEDEFSAALAAHNRPTIVDMAAIDFLASRGIGMLFGNSKRLKKSGHRLVLLNPKGMVDATLKSCQADKMMPIVYQMHDALSALQGIASDTVAVQSRVEEATDAPQTEHSRATTVPLAAKQGNWKTGIKNDLSELPGLNAALAEFLEEHSVPHRAAYAVNLAIDELVVNVIRYAYVDEDTHRIDIDLVIEDEQLILRIVDDGRSFDPRKGPSLDLHTEEREVGGLGLILVLDMVDALKYCREDEKNHVEVRIHLIPEVEAPNTCEDESSATGAQEE